VTQGCQDDDEAVIFNFPKIERSRRTRPIVGRIVMTAVTRLKAKLGGFHADFLFWKCVGKVNFSNNIYPAMDSSIFYAALVVHAVKCWVRIWGSAADICFARVSLNWIKSNMNTFPPSIGRVLCTWRRTPSRPSLANNWCAVVTHGRVRFVNKLRCRGLLAGFSV